MMGFDMEVELPNDHFKSLQSLVKELGARKQHWLQCQECFGESFCWRPAGVKRFKFSWGPVLAKWFQPLVRNSFNVLSFGSNGGADLNH